MRLVEHETSRGEAPTVFLAQPEGLEKGTPGNSRAKGLTVKLTDALGQLTAEPSTLPNIKRTEHPGLEAGPGELLGRWPGQKLKLQDQNSRFVLVFVLVVLSWLLPVDATACPSCKDHLAANGLDGGYAISILIMILAPLTILATWTVLILRLRSLTKSAPHSNAGAG